MFELQQQSLQQPQKLQHLHQLAHTPKQHQFYLENTSSTGVNTNAMLSNPKRNTNYSSAASSTYCLPASPGSPGHYSSDNSNDSTLSNSPNSSKSSNGSHSNSSSRSSSTTPLGVNLRVTGQCSQGGRKYMEDYFSVAYQQSENAKDLEYAYIGIFDGHGGAEAAIFAKEHLMMEIIKQKQFWSENDHDVLRAIREGYIATHYAMWRDQENWPKTSNGLPSTAGTTATIAFIRREKIYIGHVGDSGIVLGYQNENENFWRAKSLTNDHKPECAQERNRIRRAGGKVMVKSGVPRVVWKRPRNPGHKGPIRFNTAVDEIPFLAVARSLGDLWSYNPENKQFVVSPDPDVKVVRINPKTFRCLVFGTDGLWNVLGAQDAVDKVFEKETLNQKLNSLRTEGIYEEATENSQWSNPSKALVEEALKVWNVKRMRADNTSVVTVILYPANEDNTGFGDNNSRAHLPISYGLEYTEVQSDSPLYKDSTTYAELAEKFQPPEAYRNFNYYDVEDNEVEVEAEVETESEEETESHKSSKEQKIVVEVAANIFTQKNSNDSTACSFEANSTNLFGYQNQQHSSIVPSNQANLSENVNENAGNDLETSDSDEDGEYNARNCETYARIRRSLPSYADWNPSKTNLFLNDSHISEYDIIENENGNGTIKQRSKNAVNDTNHCSEELGGFADIGISFAETFNCLLQNQESHQENQTHIVQKSTKSYASMQEILKEQQTMSEQEGYSLTKLETRQEKAQHQHQQHTLPAPQHQQQQTQHQNTVTKKYTSYSSQTHLPHTPQQHQQQHQPQQQYIQVLEQSHQQNQQSHVVIETVNAKDSNRNPDIDKSSHSGAARSNCFWTTVELQVQPTDKKVVGEDVGDNLVSETDEDITVGCLDDCPDNQNITITKNCNDKTKSTYEDILYAEYLEEDGDAVQINEISSSNMTDITLEDLGTNTEEDDSNTAVYTLGTIEVVENIEILNPPPRITPKKIPKTSGKTNSPRMTNASNRVSGHIPKVSSLWNSMNTTHTAEIATHSSNLTDVGTGTSVMTLKRSLSKAKISPNPSPQAKRARTKNQCLYPNVPNENQSLNKHTVSTRNGNTFNRSRSHSQIPSNELNQQNIEKRQLRSSASNFNTSLGHGSSNVSYDYLKKTLRTRNGVSKDMRNKSGTFIAASNTGASRTTDTKVVMKGSNSSPCSVLISERARVSNARRIASTGNITSINNGSSTNPLRTGTPTVLNLRSRQVGEPSTTRSASTSRAEYRRNVRNIGASNSLLAATNSRISKVGDSATSSATVTTIKITPSSFSKTIKTPNTGKGSGGFSLAPPPPSPKIITLNSTISTRARSLQAAKSSASIALIKAFLPKRPSLRSNSSASMRNLNCDKNPKASQVSLAPPSTTGKTLTHSLSSTPFTSVIPTSNQTRVRTTRQKR